MVTVQSSVVMPHSSLCGIFIFEGGLYLRAGSIAFTIGSGAVPFEQILYLYLMQSPII